MEILIALVVIIGVLLFIGVSIYNELVLKRVTTENAWSQITVQLKRRYDLIPNLVETVKGYASHEKDTLEKVVKARNSAISAAEQGSDVGRQSQVETALTGALRQVFALSENYPDLKANQNFLHLQEEIVSTENKIGFSRQHYNDATAQYNTAIQQVPANIIAGMFGFLRRDFFELEPEEMSAAKEAPRVSF